MKLQRSHMAFELWCWRRLLRVPWTARRSNQSIIKEINPEYSLQGLMLKLKLQYFGYLMQRAHSLEKTLMLGKVEGRRRREQQRRSWLGGIIDSMDMSLSKHQEIVKYREAWHAAVHRVPKSWNNRATKQHQQHRTKGEWEGAGGRKDELREIWWVYGADSTGPHGHFSFHLECNREHYTEQRRGLTILGGVLGTNGRKNRRPDSSPWSITENRLHCLHTLGMYVQGTIKKILTH